MYTSLHSLMWTSFCSLEAKALGDLRMQFRLRRPDSVTSLDPAFLERMASLKVHVKDEVRFKRLRQCTLQLFATWFGHILSVI